MNKHVLSKVLAVLACPECGGDLQYDNRCSCFICEPCENKYPAVGNVVNFLQVDGELLSRAKDHWESSPIFQYEAKSPLYTKEYYEEQDRWRAEESDPFSMGEYRFEEIRGKVILDVGCGSGWLVKQAARCGAFPIGIDFTEKAVLSTAKAMEIYGLDGLVIQADAQRLPIRTEVIDRFYSVGVLHHIPDTQRGIDEAYRVTKKGGSLFISLYCRPFFFNRLMFPLAKALLRRMLKAPKVRDGLQYASDYDEFMRMVDGPTNPIGRWYDDEQLIELFVKFSILGMSRSCFPIRFLRIGRFNVRRIVPEFVHRILHRKAGIVRNVQLAKS